MATLDKNGVRFDPSTGTGNATQTAKLITPLLGNREEIPISVVYSAPGCDDITKEYRVESTDPFIVFFEGEDGAPNVDKVFEISAEGGSVIITGRSNVETMRIQVSPLGDFTVDSINNYKVKPNGHESFDVTVSNSNAIPDDPGASAAFEFQVTVTGISANTTTEIREKTITFQAAGVEPSLIETVTIKQAAGSASLSVEPTSLTIPQDGSEVSVNITSNTTWTCK